MRVAYHFDADKFGTYYGPPIEEAFFRAALEVPASRLHIRIRVANATPATQAPLADV